MVRSFDESRSARDAEKEGEGERERKGQIKTPLPLSVRYATNIAVDEGVDSRKHLAQTSPSHPLAVSRLSLPTLAPLHPSSPWSRQN